MKRLILTMVILLCASLALAHPVPNEVIAKATQATVAVRPASTEGEVADSGGTGFLVKGKETVYVWTAAHVLMPGMDVICELGEVKEPVKLKCEQVEVWLSHDVALLKVEDPPEDLKSVKAVTIRFVKETPQRGQHIYMGASLASKGAPINFLVGNLSYVSPKPEKPVDEVCIPIFKGCSGAAVLDQKGNCLGMAIAKSGCVFGLVVPARRIRTLVEEKDLLDAFPMAR